MEKTDCTPQGSIPDLSWINHHLPVSEVATALQLRVDGIMIHCWHPDNHKNGDRTASAGINKTTNRVKCFGCGSPTMSVVDLVADVLQVDVRSAVLWIDERFREKIGNHRIVKRQHIKTAEKPYRVGHENPLELLVKSGVWAQLSAPTQSVAVALLAFAESAEKGALCARLSYVGMQRNTGLKSGHSISKAVAELKGIGWLSTEFPRSHSLKRGDVQVYTITPFGDSLVEHANAVCAQKKKDISASMRIRKSESNSKIIAARHTAKEPIPINGAA